MAFDVRAEVDRMHAAMAEQIAVLQTIRSTLEQQHSAVLREWEPLRDSAGGQASSGGVATVRLQPVPLGWEWEVGRITVSAGGASNAGTVVAYNVPEGSSLAGAMQDELYMVDYKVQLDGTGPSRGIADEMTPVRMVGGDQLVVYFTGIAASVAVTARIEGLRRYL